jgi:hypothetical protein
MIEDLLKKYRDYEIGTRRISLAEYKPYTTYQLDNTKKALNLIKILIDTKLMEEPKSISDLIDLINKISINL